MSSFKFQGLASELKLMVWKAAARPNQPSAHYFTVESAGPLPIARGRVENGRHIVQYTNGPERIVGVLSRVDSRMEVGLSAPQPGTTAYSPYPSRLQDPRDQQRLAVDSSLPAGHTPNGDQDPSRAAPRWSDPQNPSVYLEDARLWTVSQGSRQAMKQIFGDQKETGIKMIREGERLPGGPSMMGGVNGGRYRQILTAGHPDPLNFDVSGHSDTINFSIALDNEGPGPQKYSQITIKPDTDLIILQPQPVWREQALRPEVAEMIKQDAEMEPAFCDCYLDLEDITPAKGNRRAWTGFEGGKCTAYTNPNLLPLFDPVDQTDAPILKHIGMVYTELNGGSHLTQEACLPTPGAGLPHEVGRDQMKIGNHLTQTADYDVHFNNHLMRMLSGLTDGRGVENFWFIDYRLKYVEFEDGVDRQGIPLADRQTFRTRDFELVEVTVADMAANPLDILCSQPSDPTANGTRTPSFNTMRVERIEYPTMDGHALSRCKQVTDWIRGWRLEYLAARNRAERDGVAFHDPTMPNYRTRFRVLAMLVKEPRGANWQRGPRRGNVYFEPRL